MIEVFSLLDEFEIVLIWLKYGYDDAVRGVYEIDVSVFAFCIGEYIIDPI